MAKQNQPKEAQSQKRNVAKPDRAPTASVSANVAGLMQPSGNYLGSLVGHSIECQSSQLLDAGIPRTQRQTIASHIGQMQGNRYLQMIAAQAVQRQGGGGGGAAPAGGGNTTPIPALPDADARRSLALWVLWRAYGGQIKQEVKVVEAAGESVLRTAYDQAMIRQKKELRVKNDKGEESFQPWKEGDSWKHPDLQDIGVFKGFNDPSSGSVYIDSTRPPDEQVVTIAHELLHANASGDFQATLGKQVDEGMTEMLTQRAFASCGYSAPKGEYAQEVSFVEDLGSMVGEGMLVSAYWGGTATLRNMLNALTDTNIFDDFAKATRTKDRKWIRQFFKEYYEKLRGGSGLDKKIAAINLALDGWVSDNDISNIEGIYNGASPEEKVQLRGAIEPRITSLVNEGQRVRLRQLTGF